MCLFCGNVNQFFLKTFLFAFLFVLFKKNAALRKLKERRWELWDGVTKALGAGWIVTLQLYT